MKSNRDEPVTNNKAALAGAAIYSKPVLSIYDSFVLGFSNAYVWNSSLRRMLSFYDEHVSANHLDVGVGTGYFLDNCVFPSDSPAISLLDLNPNSLQAASRRISRYRPTTYAANILEALAAELPRFDSVGLNFLLHCLPGSMLSKGAVFRNLEPYLNGSGVVFGTTILGQGVAQNALARLFMRFYNSRGIFDNMQDNATDLERILKESYGNYSIEVEGSVAYFTGRR